MFHIVHSYFIFISYLYDILLTYGFQTLPDELIHNSKLQNLDLGNNVITTWSEVKVRYAYLEFSLFLTFHSCLGHSLPCMCLNHVLQLQVLKSLTNLKNLNLQGNPVASSDKITRKVIPLFLWSTC